MRPCQLSHSNFTLISHSFLNDVLFQVLERSQEAMQDDAQGAPAGGTGGLAHLLLNSYQERLIQNRLQEEQEREEGAREEDEDEEDDGERG